MGLSPSIRAAVRLHDLPSRLVGTAVLKQRMLMDMACMRRGHPCPRLDMLIHCDDEEGQTRQGCLLHSSPGVCRSIPML